MSIYGHYGGITNQKKTRDLAHEYNKKFNTEEWDWFIGKYAEQQKRFDVALSYFDKSSDDYNRVKKIFDDYDSLYKDEKYKEVIEYFENKLNLSHSKTKHEIVHKYLWSLYKNSGTEKKALEKTKVFLEKYGDSDRWFNLAGHINKYLGKHNKNDNIIYLNDALFFFQKTGNEEEIKIVNDIIKNYKNPEWLLKTYYDRKHYDKVITLFESDKSFKTNEEIVNKYLWSLYKNSGTEKKALEKTKVFLEKYGDSDRWFNLAGHINKYLGKHNKNDNIIYLNDALFFFQKTGNEEEIKIVNDIIKQQAKEAAAREKQQTKEAVAREKQQTKEAVAREKQLAKEAAQDKKNKTHDYSISNGISYCRYCGGGDTAEIRSSPCTRELGHKYTLRKTKYNGFQPICNTCGDERKYCIPLSENTKICGVTVGFYTCEEYLGYMRTIS